MSFVINDINYSLHSQLTSVLDVRTEIKKSLVVRKKN